MICEGQTEETFAKELLTPHFVSMGIAISPSLIGRAGHKGGRIEFQRLRLDLRNRLLGDPTAYCTTFFDFYALPRDFPGRAEAEELRSIEQKAHQIETAIRAEAEHFIGQAPTRRLIPYVQMHEFEGLLFSHPERMAEGMDQPDLVPSFGQIRAAFESPEHINDSQQTAPSKRIQTLFQAYQKPLHGILAALEIGLPSIRQQCDRFHQWLTLIESLTQIRPD
jgi:hypothetical protein